MNILDIKHNPSTVDVEAEVDSAQWQAKVQALVNDQIKKVKVDGFRVGKVPYEIAVKYVDFGRVYEKAINSMLDTLMESLEADEKFVKDESEIVGDPIVNFKEVDNDHCILQATYDLAPVVTLPDYKDIELKDIKPVVVLNDEQAWEEFKKDYHMDADAPMTDETIAALNLDDIKTVADALAWIKEYASEETRIENRKVAGNQIAVYLIKNTTISHLPTSYVKERTTALLQQAEQSFKDKGITTKEYLKMTGKSQNEFIQEMIDNARKEVVVSLAFEEIILQEHIEATEDDIDEFVRKFAKLFNTAGNDVEQFKSALIKSGQIDYIRSMILNNKVIDKLIEYNTK